MRCFDKASVLRLTTMMMLLMVMLTMMMMLLPGGKMMRWYVAFLHAPDKP